MAPTTIKTTVSNPSGHGHNASLDAIIDDIIGENIIPRKCLEQLQHSLKLTKTPLGSVQALRDSRGVSYTAQHKVRLLIKPCDGARTEALWFYIADSENTRVAGGHDIIVAKSWRQKFGLDAQDDSKIYPAAPTEYRKGKTSADREEWNRKVEENNKKNLENAKQLEAAWEKELKELKEKEKAKGK